MKIFTKQSIISGLIIMIFPLHSLGSDSPIPKWHIGIKNTFPITLILERPYGETFATRYSGFLVKRDYKKHFFYFDYGLRLTGDRTNKELIQANLVTYNHYDLIAAQRNNCYSFGAGRAWEFFNNRMRIDLQAGLSALQSRSEYLYAYNDWLSGQISYIQYPRISWFLGGHLSLSPMYTINFPSNNVSIGAYYDQYIFSNQTYNSYGLLMRCKLNST